MDPATSVALPEAFILRMKKQLGPEYMDFEHALRYRNKERGLRVNKTKIAVADYLKVTPFDLEKIPYAEDGFYFPYDIKMGSDPARHAGMIYLQDPSAMIPVNAVHIKPGWKMLDLCASPGGKTAQFSDAVGENGLVIANNIRNGSDLLNRLELSLDDTKLLRYLQGMDLESDKPDGWGAVTVCGCAAGGFRSANGTLHNLYPDILRNWVS